MNIIDCLSIRDDILKDVKNQLQHIKDKYNEVPNLTVIQVGDNPASATYVRNKIKLCESLGIGSSVIKLTENASETEVLEAINKCNKSSDCHGILLQLPLPNHLSKYEKQCVDAIDPNKDVDGLTSINIGKLWSGLECVTPCTPTGILRLLGDDLSGKVVTILGRSILVGNPLIKMLQDRNATVVSCHSRTTSGAIELAMKNSDIVISAIGKPKYFKAWDFQIHDENGMRMRCKNIIDVGINRDNNGKLCGDIDISTFDGLDVNITPVPKGVGVLTTAQLMLNVIKCYNKIKKI